MLRKYFYTLFAILLTSCTAETYIEFDDLMLEINGLELQSNLGLDSSLVDKLQQTTTPKECFEVDIKGVEESFTGYLALGITFEMYLSAIGSTMQLTFDNMTVSRVEEWDEWAKSVYGVDINVGHIIFDLNNSDIDMILVYDYDNKQYLMTIFTNVPQYDDSRIHFGFKKPTGVQYVDTDNVFWFDCSNDAFTQGIEWFKNNS